jgi:methylmalonyl-CoA epimerase
MTQVTNIHHIGIVVNNYQKSLKFWQDILGIDLDYVENVASMNLNLAWLPVGKTRIELLEPTSTEDNEYYAQLTSTGAGFNHLCVEVDDIGEMVKKLKENNIRLKGESIIELPGRKLIFLEPECCDGVCVELYELT